MKITSYKILWYLNDICNQRCHYCISGVEKTGINRSINNLELQNLKDCINELDIENIEFVLLGGEPTLHPSLTKIIEFLISNFKDSNVKIYLTSNFKNGIPSELIKYKENLFLRFSMHLPYYSEKWFSVINYAISNNMEITCNIMYDITYKDRLHQVLNRILNFRSSPFFSFDLKRIIPDFSPAVSSFLTDRKTNLMYSSDDIDLLKRFRLSPRKKLRNKRFCLVGSNKIGISSTGDLFYLCKFNKKLGNIFLMNSKTFKKNIFSIHKCPFNVCSCPGSILPIQSDNRKELENLIFKR